MPPRATTNVNRVLRTALNTLRSERERLGHQIAAIETMLAVDSLPGRRGRASAAAPRRRRRRMSLAARQAVSRRMKAYWAKRRAQPAKPGRKAAK